MAHYKMNLAKEKEGSMDSLLSTNHWCSQHWFYAKGKEPIEKERGKTV